MWPKMVDKLTLVIQNSFLYNNMGNNSTAHTCNKTGINSALLTLNRSSLEARGTLITWRQYKIIWSKFSIEIFLKSCMHFFFNFKDLFRHSIIQDIANYSLLLIDTNNLLLLLTVTCKVNNFYTFSRKLILLLWLLHVWRDLRFMKL